MTGIENLRIHFYGVQGSGSTFPSREERDAHRLVMDCRLLEQVFVELERYLKDRDPAGISVPDFLGGPVADDTLTAFRGRLDVSTPRVYGGWTTCVWIEAADDYDIVLDCGSGFRNCAIDLQKKWGDRIHRDVHIFGSHSHLDHTEGFDQAAICFDRRNTLHIYGNSQFLYALDSYLGIFSRAVDESRRGVQTPIWYPLMPARFLGNRIGGSEDSQPGIASDPVETKSVHELEVPIVLGRTRITPFEVHHPAPCLAYRIEHGGKKFVFCTDHELRHGKDPGDPRQQASQAAEERLAGHASHADLLYRDGQYLRSEYDGLSGIGDSPPLSRLGWGHSCVEDIQRMAAECSIQRTLIGHHDPNRGWSEKNWIDETLARQTRPRKGSLELAQAGMVIEL